MRSLSIGDDAGLETSPLEGIRIDGEGRVREIALRSRGLTGPFPFEHMRGCAKLEALDIGENQLVGELPADMGTAACLPHLWRLKVGTNKGIGGEICLELMRKQGLDLEIFNSGKRIRTPFLVGVTVASETISELLWSTHHVLLISVLNSGDRVQAKVPTVSVTDVMFMLEKASDGTMPADEHRCIREKRGSSGDKYNPWQFVWRQGLYRLGEQAKSEGKTLDVFSVCHASSKDATTSKVRFEGVFEKKFLAQDMPADEQARKHFADDFDPRYGLGGEVAHSILDWERRVMENAVKEFKGGLRLRYISERGLEVGDKEGGEEGERGEAFRPRGYQTDEKGRPAWYEPTGVVPLAAKAPAKEGDATAAGQGGGRIVAHGGQAGVV